MNVPALFGRLSLMCFVLRQTQRDNESPHPWDLACGGRGSQTPLPECYGGWLSQVPHKKECCARYFGKHWWVCVWLCRSWSSHQEGWSPCVLDSMPLRDACKQYAESVWAKIGKIVDLLLQQWSRLDWQSDSTFLGGGTSRHSIFPSGWTVSSLPSGLIVV